MMENEVLISLWPIILVNCILLLSFIIFAFIYQRRPKDTTIPEFNKNTFVGLFLREFGYWFTYPFLYLCKKFKITPNALTAVSPFIAIISGYYYYKGEFAIAGWIFGVGGILDFLDGRLARATNQITKEGAFLDSNLDRYSDGIVLGGLALYFRDNLFMLAVSILSIIGTQVISYAKARGELSGVSVKIGLMQRTERYFLLGIPSIFYPFIMLLLNKHGITTEYPMIIVLILMALLTNYTALVRIIYAFRQIRKR